MSDLSSFDRIQPNEPEPENESPEMAVIKELRTALNKELKESKRLRAELAQVSAERDEMLRRIGANETATLLTKVVEAQCLETAKVAADRDTLSRRVVVLEKALGKLLGRAAVRAVLQATMSQESLDEINALLPLTPSQPPTATEGESHQRTLATPK